MKKSSLAALLLLTASAGFAQQKPDENLTFDTDDFIHEPKFTISVGYRGISGAKTTFSGKVHVESTLPDVPLKGTDAVRTYSDGSVGLDTRKQKDENGVEITVTNADGTISSVPIVPDGKTNTWSAATVKQITGDGTATMHNYAYSADIDEAGLNGKDPAMSYGAEVVLRREMNQISTRFDWTIFGGLSVNDIRGQSDTSQRATITRMTDTYAMDATAADGSAAPTTGPYAAPSNTFVPVTNAGGSITTQTVDTTVLLGNEPINRTFDSKISTGALTNHWRMKGAYYTFRAGPTIVIPLGERWKITLSAGGALVYAGSTYSIEQEFTPEDGGTTIKESVEDTANKLLPGYYADANVEYWLTDRAGFYVGGVHQSSGTYTQRLNTDTGSYSSKVDLSSLQGFRMGMNIRF